MNSQLDSAEQRRLNREEETPAALMRAVCAAVHLLGCTHNEAERTARVAWAQLGRVELTPKAWFAAIESHMDSGGGS